MDTLVRAVRRGLPRVAGGAPWPQVDAPEPAPRALGSVASLSSSTPDGVRSPSRGSFASGPEGSGAPAGAQPIGGEVPGPSGSSQSPDAPGVAGASVVNATAGAHDGNGSPVEAGAAKMTFAPAFARRGLPRAGGGEAWPAEGTPVPERFLRAVPAAAPAAAGAAAAVSGATAGSSETGATTPGLASAVAVSAEPGVDLATATTLTGAHTGERPVAASAAAQAFARRGLPRVAGGAPWPAEGTPVPERWLRAVPAGTSPDPLDGTATAGPNASAQARAGDTLSSGAPAERTTSAVSAAAGSTPAAGASAPTAAATTASVAAPTSSAAPIQAQPASRPAAQATTGASRPSAPTAGTPSSGIAKGKPAKAPAPLRGRYTTAGWIGRGLAALAGLLAVAGILVLAARGLTTFQGVRDFLERYPGEYHLPTSAPVGLPAWVGWQHFLNVFLMVLIVRSGLQVRHQKKPPAFFTPRGGGKKVSLNLWLHQSLDVLWMLNGVVFVVLLFATGQWMRVIPTSWEVVPNALSAALQYATLEWPVENGWVNYNALQQLAYGLTIFVAAPLAALSGWRMSALWPSKAAGLTRVYKVEWARAVHFPVMLYFVAFALVHVILVLSTGALRNLNHMYAAHDGTGWIGFLTFAGSLLVIAGAWFAARPMLLAPLASKFGSVSSR